MYTSIHEDSLAPKRYIHVPGLILAPPAARRYVVAHEVAHLKHLDHGPAFKALERELFGGDVAAANSILRSEGLRLRRIGLVR